MCFLGFFNPLNLAVASYVFLQYSSSGTHPAAPLPQQLPVIHTSSTPTCSACFNLTSTRIRRRRLFLHKTHIKQTKKSHLSKQWYHWLQKTLKTSFPVHRVLQKHALGAEQQKRKRKWCKSVKEREVGT